jgi:RimJ/RimL family protein N-acetyltransferase
MPVLPSSARSDRADRKRATGVSSGFKKQLSARDLETLTAVDHHGHEALVALDAETGEAIGVAGMMQEPGRADTAEASVSVADAWQGRGLGGMLLERSVTRAHEEGMRRFTAVLLTRNLAMLHLFEHLGAARIASRYGDTLELEVELPFETGAPMEEIQPPNALPWQPESACAMIRA